MIEAEVATQSVTNLVVCLFVLNLGFCSAVRSSVVFDDDVVAEAAPEVTWGDLYLQSKLERHGLRVCWAVFCVLLLLCLCWRTLQPIEGAFHKETEMKWYSMALASFLSHVPGLVGFAGFACLVLESALCKSKPGDGVTSTDFWLFGMTASFAVTAWIASFVFLTVDYLRRLAIERARLQNMQLHHGDTKLWQTGLGRLLILLGVLMLCLLQYKLIEEVGLAFDGDMKSFATKLWLIVSRCLPAVIYILDVLALCSTPKVRYNDSCDAVREGVSLIQFLQNGSPDGEAEREANRSVAAIDRLLQLSAGEDFKFFARNPSLQLIFPGQPLVRLGHILAFALALWACPAIVDVYIGQNYLVQPQIIDLWPWYGAQMQPHLFNTTEPKYTFLATGSNVGLQFVPNFAQVTRWELCCLARGCKGESVPHWLVKESNKTIDLELPANYTGLCRLALHGHAEDKVKMLVLNIQSMAKFNISRCSDSQCSCMDGYAGSVTWNGPASQGQCLPAPCAVENSNNEAGWKCKCRDFYIGTLLWHADAPLGNCTAAPCDILNSNRQAATCKCLGGFSGNITWNGAVASGSCEPAPCNVTNSNRKPGLECACAAGFGGWIEWHGAMASGACRPAPCKVAHSNKFLGPDCRCKDGYVGEITWNGIVAIGPCKPAACRIAGSNKLRGLDCRCKDGYVGEITWNGTVATGRCEPPACRIAGSNKLPGLDCRCKDAYNGSIFWNGTVAFGSCTPATCAIPNSNERPGPDCACLDGFNGYITWKGTAASGSCTPAPCNILNSNFLDGRNCSCRDGFSGEVQLYETRDWKYEYAILDPTTKSPGYECLPAVCNITNSDQVPGQQCKCLPGFGGEIRWNGAVPLGSCEPAACEIAHSNNQAGPDCRCSDGYKGHIAWNGTVALGSCEAAACTIPNSNGEVGLECDCLDGFNGRITWNGSVASGSCRPVPCEVQNSNRMDWPNCSCLDGFSGEVAVRWVDSLQGWEYGVVDRMAWGYGYRSACRPAECNIRGSNHQAGPSCACLGGYKGDIRWTGTVPHAFVNGIATDSCESAPCNIKNSNKKGGIACQCLDGFAGEVWWERDQVRVRDVDTLKVSDSCWPAPCNIANSNRVPGPECKCGDAFRGNITWRGAASFGLCEPAPCTVPYSNKKDGSECQCLHGGRIAWKGGAASGPCVPAAVGTKSMEAQSMSF